MPTLLQATTAHSFSLFEKETATIFSTPVDARKRPKILSKYMGQLFLDFERAVYFFMDNLSPDYSGAYWNFYELSNGGFFMSPRIDQRLSMTSPFGNFYEGGMSCTAAGISACIFAYTYLAEKYESENMLKLLDLLKDYARGHVESS